MSKFGEGKANGKEKSSFFSAFGKKKKADKPQYDGDMKHGKANGKVCRPAAKRTSSPATHLTAISRRPHVFVCICRVNSCLHTCSRLTCSCPLRGAVRGRTGTRTRASGGTTVCTEGACLCGSTSRVVTRARYGAAALTPFYQPFFQNRVLQDVVSVSVLI